MAPDKVKKSIISAFIRKIISKTTNSDVESFLSNELDNVDEYVSTTENEIVLAGYMHPNTFESLKGVSPELKKNSLVKHDNYLNIFVSPDYLAMRASEMDRIDLDIDALVRDNADEVRIDDYYDLEEYIDDLITDYSYDENDYYDEDDDEDYGPPF